MFKLIPRIKNIGSFLDFEHVFLLIFLQNLIREVEPKLGLALIRVATWDSKLYCSWKGVRKMGPCGRGVGEEVLFVWGG